MSLIGAQNLRLGNNLGLQVVNGRDLGLKANTDHFEIDANGIRLKDGAVSTAQLDAELAALLNVGLKRATWVVVANNHTLTDGEQPASLPDSYFAGKVAEGSVNGNGTLGVVCGSFESVEAETGTDEGQAGLGAAAAPDRPYPVADFSGQRGIFALLQKKDGDDVLLGELLSTATGADASARVFGYLSFRPDLAANARWRLWLYYTRGTDGLEVAFTPDQTLSGLSIHVAEVFAMADLPVRSGLGLVSPAGQAAAAVGPKSIGSSELDDAAVSAAKLADSAVSTSKLAENSVTSAKLKMRRRFDRVVGNAGNGATLSLSRSILAGREEGVMVSEDNATIDYVSANPESAPNKAFTASGSTITLGFTQVQGAVYRVWFDSESP